MSQNKSILLATVALLALMGTTAATQAREDTQTSDRNELTRLELVWNQAHQRGEADVLDRLWADDLEVAVPKMPIFRKPELLSFVTSGSMKFLRYETSDLRIRIYADSAVVTGRLQRARAMNGRELSDDWRFTKVYVRRKGQWRVVAFHASEAAPQP